MKYAITGHTQGLGQAIARHVGEANVVGFSRSNGYNITLLEHRQRIVQAALDCDVFINNAHAGYSQTQLLYDVWSAWGDMHKTIVNIGSNTTDGIKNHAHQYTAQKASLEKASEQLSNLNRPCRVCVFRFGYIGTERVIQEYNPTSFIQPQQAAEFIVETLKIVHPHRLTSITMLPG